MAKQTAYMHRIKRDHPVASKMKPGQVMSAKMKMMEPDDDDETYPMEEVSSEPYEEGPTNQGKKVKGPIEYLKSKRQIT